VCQADAARGLMLAAASTSQLSALSLLHLLHRVMQLSCTQPP
jgi:hypothetical protein